jgi:hypothetical protein
VRQRIIAIFFSGSNIIMFIYVIASSLVLYRVCVGATCTAEMMYPATDIISTGADPAPAVTVINGPL